jgi:hypothetical protein
MEREETKGSQFESLLESEDFAYEYRPEEEDLYREMLEFEE